MTVMEAWVCAAPWVLKWLLGIHCQDSKTGYYPSCFPLSSMVLDLILSFATKSSVLLNTKNQVVNSNQFLNSCLQVLSLSFPLGQFVQMHTVTRPWLPDHWDSRVWRALVQSAILHLLRDGAEQENIRFGRITELKSQNKTSPSPPRRSQSNERQPQIACVRQTCEYIAFQTCQTARCSARVITRPLVSLWGNYYIANYW